MIRRFFDELRCFSHDLTAVITITPLIFKFLDILIQKDTQVGVSIFLAAL